MNGQSQNQNIYQNQIASGVLRFWAYVADAIILNILYLPLMYFLQRSLFKSFFANPFEMLSNFFEFYSKIFLVGTVYFAVCIFYFGFMTGKYGASLGKMACGLRVIKENGQKITYGTAFFREFLKEMIFIVFSPLHLVVLIDSKKQGLHDKAAKTIVIKTKQGNKKLIIFLIVLFLLEMFVPILLVGSIFKDVGKTINSNSFFNQFNQFVNLENIPLNFNENKNINVNTLVNENTNTPVSMASCETKSFKCTSMSAIGHQFQETKNNYVVLNIYGVIDPTASLTGGYPGIFPLMVDGQKVADCLPASDWINGEIYFGCIVIAEDYKPGSSASLELSFNDNTENLSFNLTQINKNINNEAVSYIYYPRGRTSETIKIIYDHVSKKKLPDSDNDGLPDTIEDWFGSNKNKTDSDGDGYSDSEEVNKCYNPIGEGKMSQDNYLTYCFALLKDMGMSQQIEICNEWKDTANVIINANLTKPNELDLTNEYDKHCPNTQTMLKDQNVINSICSMIIMTATSMCDPLRYADLLPIKSGI